MNNTPNPKEKPSINNYFNYKINIPEAIVYFFLTIIVGQIFSAIIMIPMSMFPFLTGFLLPLSFLLGFSAAAIFIMALKKLRLDQLKHFFHTKINITTAAIAVGLYFTALPIAEYLSMLIPTEGNPLLEELYRIFEQSFAIVFEYKVAAFIMVCILAPVLEELIFRGLILRGLLNNGINPWVSIILTSFLFGAAHLNPWQFMGAGLLGAVFGFVYWRTQSLWLVIFLHFLNNFIAFIFTMKTENLDEPIFQANVRILLSAIILTALMGYTFYRTSGSTTLNKVQNPDEFNEYND